MKTCFLCGTDYYCSSVGDGTGHGNNGLEEHVAWEHFEFFNINVPYLRAVRCWCGRLFYFKDALAEHLRRMGNVEKHYYDSALNAIAKLDDS